VFPETPITKKSIIWDDGMLICLNKCVTLLYTCILKYHMVNFKYMQ
jgi:hypothetical protein